jgi:hypothetical protein
MFVDIRRKCSWTTGGNFRGHKEEMSVSISRKMSVSIRRKMSVSIRRKMSVSIRRKYRAQKL